MGSPLIPTKIGRSTGNGTYIIIVKLHNFSVLFDAPQIPAGMHPFCQILQDFTEFQWNGTGILWSKAGVLWNGPGFHQILTGGTCISAYKYECVYINRLL